MSANKNYTAQYEALPKIAKLLIQFFLGAIVGGIYRIVRFLETGNTTTLIAGILVLVTGIGNFIAWVVDFVTELLNDKITVFAD